MDLVKVVSIGEQGSKYLMLSSVLKEHNLTILIEEVMYQVWQASIVGINRPFQIYSYTPRNALLDLIIDLNKNRDLYKDTEVQLKPHQKYIIPDPDIFKFVGGDVPEPIFFYGKSK